MRLKRENIIWAYFDAQSGFDIQQLEDHLAPDVILFDAEGLPWSGIYYGRMGIANYLSKLTRYITHEIRLEEIYSCNTKVVTIGKSIGTVNKTGQAFDIRLVQLFTFDDYDQIERLEFVPDLSAFERALANRPVYF